MAHRKRGDRSRSRPGGPGEDRAANRPRSGTSAFLTWAVPMRPDGSSGSLQEKAKKRRQICSPSSDLRSRTAARRTRSLDKGPHRISDGDAVAQPQSHPAPATWATQRGNPLPAWQQPLAPRPEPWGRNDLLAPQRRTNLISVPRFWKTKPGDHTKAQKRSRGCASGAPDPQPGQERARASRDPKRGPRLGVEVERLWWPGLRPDWKGARLGARTERHPGLARRQRSEASLRVWAL